MKKYLHFLKNNKISKIQFLNLAWSKTYIIALFFLILFLFLISRLFGYTVIEGKYYKQLADEQQIGESIVPVNRGTIYSSVERESGIQKGSSFATSINLYDVAIDPQIKGDKNKLGKFLVDFIYQEICENQGYKKCKSNMRKFLKKSEIPNFIYEEKGVKAILHTEVFKRLSQKKVTSSLIDREFTPEQISKLKKVHLKGVYTSGNHVYINPEEFLPSNISTLSTILDMTKVKLKSVTKKREVRYIPLLSKISIKGGEELKNFIKEEKGAIRRGIVKKEDSISGFFILDPKPNRYYPEGSIASQIVGFVDNAGIGHYGIEGFFNDILKGNNGKIISKKDVKGRIIDPISLEKEDLIGEGIQVVTTIDRNIQKKVEEIIKKGVEEFRAVKGTIVVTEPKTGRVLSMANYPTYDANNYGDVYELEKLNYDDFPNPEVDLLGYDVYVEDSIDGKKFRYDSKDIYLRKATSEEKLDTALVKYKYKNWFGAGVYKNDAISSLYEPGSIMKAITVAIGIDTGEIKPTDMYQDKGFVEVGTFKIYNDNQKKCNGYQNFSNALNFSCNVGMIRIFQRVGRALTHQYFEDFGFSGNTGIELDGEVSSKLKPWQKISRANFFTRSYGLGVSATPLQMALAYNALANGGFYIKPQIIDKIIYPDGRVHTYKKEIKRRIIKESTSMTVTKMLHDSVEKGFASRGKVEGYNIAGKTGTSQIFYRGRYQNGPGWTNAFYAGYGPIEDAKFVIIVKLERPKTNVYGANTAGNLFHEVAAYLIDYYQIINPEKQK